MTNIGTNKAWASGVAGGIVTVAVFGLKQFDIEVSPELSAAVVTLLGTLLVYLVPHGG